MINAVSKKDPQNFIRINDIIISSLKKTDDTLVLLVVFNEYKRASVFHEKFLFYLDFIFKFYKNLHYFDFFLLHPVDIRMF